MEPSRILMVEDERLTRRRVEAMLTNLGCQVRSVETGEQGLTLFAPGTFDVVLCDVNLPGMDGIEAIRRMLTADPALAPIIMTSRRDPETAVRAMELGIRAFLLKPFCEEELKRKLERALVERRLVQDRLLVGDLLRIRSDLAQKVQEQERFLHQMINAAPFAIISTDPRGRILTYNQMAERMYGYHPREVIGRQIGVLADDPTFDAAAPSPTGPAKVHHRRRDGSSLPVLVQRSDIVGEEGREIAHLHVVEDLTEREQMEAQMVYAEKLSLLGQLAPRIAHELKAPLQVVSGHAELGLQWLQAGKALEARSSLERIQPAVARILALVRQMLHLGKPEQTTYQALDLAAEMEKTLALLEGLGAIKRCELVRQFAAGLPRVQGDPVQIEQVFDNLVINAVQAMEDSSRRVLTLGVQPGAQDRRVEVTVADTGPGIDSENLERVFQPFFTTKPEGTGLGLPIVRTILDRHGATIAVHSSVGEGTRFTLSFPAAG